MPSISEVCSKEEAIADPTSRHDMPQNVRCGEENTFMNQQNEVCEWTPSGSDTRMPVLGTYYGQVKSSAVLVEWFWNGSRGNRTPRLGIHRVRHGRDELQGSN